MSEILDNRGMTAYGLAKASGGALSLSACYRLAADDWDQLSRETLTALCDALSVTPADLFVFAPKSGSRSGTRPPQEP